MARSRRITSRADRQLCRWAKNGIVGNLPPSHLTPISRNWTPKLPQVPLEEMWAPRHSRRPAAGRKPRPSPLSGDGPRLDHLLDFSLPALPGGAEVVFELEA